MTRWLDLYVMVDNEPLRITYKAAAAGSYSYDPKRDALKIGGCGMDMGFAVVYDLGRTMYPDGFETPEGYWRNEPLDWDPDGGYALNHRWM
jgi:hypothetical protein